jgi:NitT/TauT family transport system permease protein
MVTLIKDHPGHFFANWWATFSVSITASLLAICASLVMSVLALRFKMMEILFAPIIAISQSFPLQAIAPLIIILLGTGFHTKTSIAFVIAFFPIYGAFLTSIKTTPSNILAHLAICHTSFTRGVRYGRLPYALPALISAAKVGFTLAVLGAVVAEFIHPDKGLGYLILVAQSSYNVEVIYVCVLLLIMQGIAVYGGLSVLENKIIRNRTR